MPELSVVIPTFNRVDILPRVLAALGTQSLAPDQFEVIVVDDGSADGTATFLKSYRPPYSFTIFAQANSGPAGARNRGVLAARAPLVLFIGDDTVPEAALLEVHRDAHRQAPGRKISVLGYTTWPRGKRVTPFLHHINEFGLQFGYALIQDPESVPFNFFYTSNISLPRQALLDIGLFDTSFPHAAWEDIELSYRLSQKGYVIVYRPRAVARHFHHITLASFRRRQEKSGRSAALFYRKHPELADFLGVGAALAGAPRASAVLRWRAALSERFAIPGGGRAIDSLLKADYLRGLRRALTGNERGREFA